MTNIQTPLSKTFNRFFESERSSGILIIICTLIALMVTNSPFGNVYLHLWQLEFAGLSIEHWINDGLMAVFFLFVGLELQRELSNGDLSDFKKALLPIWAAVGGIMLPALIHFVLNANTPTQDGIGIPMATDIAFALGVLALLGSRIPDSLKVFLTALAVIDDLGAIIVIALFYTANLATSNLLMAMTVFVILLLMNRVLRVNSLTPYLVGGVIMWFFMLKSGVHATIAGVMLAFTIPYSNQQDDESSPSHKLEFFLSKPVAFLILPVFALANAGILIGANWADDLNTSNSLGIFAGLVIGKPLGISLFVFLAVAIGICKLPSDMNWKHVVGAGLLGGIGFTMSIFITNLAFTGQAELINASKIAIFLASLLAGTLGFVWLRLLGKSSSN